MTQAEDLDFGARGEIGGGGLRKSGGILGLLGGLARRWVGWAFVGGEGFSGGGRAGGQPGDS